MKRHSMFSVQGSAFSVRSVRRSFSEGAFTLVEILVVLAIILVLASIVISTAKYAQAKAARSRTQAEMAAMETALESYKNDNGAFPPGDNTWKSATNLHKALVGGSKTYMNFKPSQIVELPTPPVSTNIMDPFGRPYYYQYPGVSNSANFDLWSAGPDAQTNTPDDIVNWRQQ